MHGYTFGPTLSESEIAAFEQAHGIRLPDDYRLFLREAGNGGVRRRTGTTRGSSAPGPDYGITELEETASDCDLGRPFPYREEEGAVSDTDAVLWPDDDTFPGGPGYLPFGDKGCGAYAALIVSGPGYGRLWIVSEFKFLPMNVTFGDRYRQWMTFLSDRALPVLAAERKVTGVTVGMSKAEVIRICGGRWRQRADFEGPGSELLFEHLATQYKLDGNERVTRRIAHSLYEQNLFDFATKRIIDAS